MLQRHYTPRWPLSEFVELLWLYDGYEVPHAKERLLPDGSMELVINLREPQTRMYDPVQLERSEDYGGCVIVGPHSQFFVIDTAEQQSVMGAHFKPGGAFPFFRPPANELHNRWFSLDDLWAAKASELRDRLLEAHTPEMKFQILEEALLEQAHESFDRHPAVAFALKEFSGVPHARTIAQVTDQIGLSAKRFIHVFREEVGLTPKLFCRVRRFQRVLASIGKGRRVEWADIAASCGYFDQAHFIRDFQAFSGLNPSVYLTQRTEHLNHVPILD